MCGGCTCGLAEKDDDKPVNLYWVQVGYEEFSWGYFVFATSRNRAKSICVHHFHEEEEYIDFRTRTLKKNVNMVRRDSIIDSPDDPGYGRVTELGFYYVDEKEDSQWMNQPDN